MKHAWVTVFVFLLSGGTSHGDTYKYIDENGITCFTDNIKNIPEKCRKKAVLLKEDDGKVTVAPPPQADKTDESVLSQKEEVIIKTETSAPLPDQGTDTKNFPYRNVAIISSMFLATLIPTFFLNNRDINRILGIASLASVLTLLVYISTFFVSRHMQTLKKDAMEITEAMKKKEEEKGKAIQDALGSEALTQTDK